MPDSLEIDWKRLRDDLGVLAGSADVSSAERGSSDLARAALEALVTPARIAGTVDYYVSGAPGFELARSVLWLIRPWAAMLRCKEIFDSTAAVDTRRSAIELLRVVADRRVLPWLDEFFDDSDDGIQFWAMGILEQLASSGLVEAHECLPFLQRAQTHRNEKVRQLASCIAERLDEMRDEAG